MVEHHPTPELLAAFSAGSVPLSQALSIGVHLEYCHECRINVQRLNNLGAQILESIEPSAVSDELRSRVFSQLDDERSEPEQHAPKNSDHKHIPRCLHQFIPQEGYDSLKWRRLSSSLETVNLCTDNNGAKVGMLRIKPGGKIATHTHTGDEFTIVLEGSFSDESGIYKTGDFVFRDARHKHRPIATKDSPCICLSVTDAPIAFTGFFTRWLNPFLRKSYAT